MKIPYKFDIKLEFLTIFLSIYLIANLNALFASEADSVNIYDYDLQKLSQIKINSASKSPQLIREIPSSVKIITSNDIVEKGYFNLEDVLGDLPGFQFRNIQSFNTYSFLRGIPNQNNLILILVDGIQINELNSGGFYGGGHYNLENVDRIEFVYGPSSVAYGTNAVSGIINIITKTAVNNSVSLKSLAGNFNTYQGNFGFSNYNEKNNFGIRLAGMFKNTDKAELAGSAGDNNWTDQLDNFETDYSVDLKLQYEKFTFGTNFQQKKSSISTIVKSIGTKYRDFGTLWNIMFLNNYLRYTNSIIDNLNINLTLYNRNATVLDNSVQYVLDTAQMGYYRPNNLTGIEGVLTYKTNFGLSLTGGLNLEYEQLAEKFSITKSNSYLVKPPKPNSPNMLKNNLISLFFEPQLNIFEDLFVSAGLRFDYSSVYKDVLTPKIGIIYLFGKHSARVSYSEAFRAPKPWDYNDGLGNSGLLPEKMKSVEGGINIAILENLKMDIAAYSNLFENAITKLTLSDGFKWINEGKITTDGIEVTFNYFLQNIKCSMNYTYNNSVDTEGDRIPEISCHTANADLTYSLTDNIKFNLRANYSYERINPKLITATNSNIIEPFLVINTNLSYLDYKGFNFFLTIRNLLDVEYYHTSNREIERYRQSQRTILFSVSYQLTE